VRFYARVACGARDRDLIMRDYGISDHSLAVLIGRNYHNLDYDRDEKKSRVRLASAFEIVIKLRLKMARF